ncbi:MAG: ACP S-malonyltransferase [Planctomycetota bacterium]|jgi:[acyl-carrier-protein] S-malonyltransferase|nr:ACP S-malonyltransferase [Planctomycetota bacterium]
MDHSLIFPGQGAQFIGMGRDFYDNSVDARELFDQADEVLGFKLSSICFDGPDDKLTDTDIAQPAIYVCSLAALAALQERHGQELIPTQTAGLSLGEYTAMCAAKAFGFADGLRLVQLRGRAMQDASIAKPSSMTSVMGLDCQQLDDLCAKVAAETSQICQVANLNSPGQIVVSGELKALDALEQAATDAGARRAIRLTVAGAFHSEVMRPAADKLAAALSETEFSTPLCPVWQNATATASTDIEVLRQNLQQQLCAPVLWQKSFATMSENYAGTFIEPAPGKVLTAMARKINREAKVSALSNFESINDLLN